MRLIITQTWWGTWGTLERRLDDVTLIANICHFLLGWFCSPCFLRWSWRLALPNHKQWRLAFALGAIKLITVCVCVCVCACVRECMIKPARTISPTFSYSLMNSNFVLFNKKFHLSTAEKCTWVELCIFK
jgi:hypothetical protein